MPLNSRSYKERIFRFESEIKNNEKDYYESFYYLIRDATYKDNLLEEVTIDQIVFISEYFKDNKITKGLILKSPHIPNSIQTSLKEWEKLKEINL